MKNTFFRLIVLFGEDSDRWFVCHSGGVKVRGLHILHVV